MADLNLTPFNPLYPMRIHQYDELINDSNVNVMDKVNAIIDYLNKVGKLTNDVVKDWNTVYQWTMNDGLTTGINNKLEDMLAKGEFDSIISTVVALVGDLSTLTTSDKTTIVNAINSLKSDLNDSIGLKADQTALNTTNANIGDLTTLQTTDKDSLVHAINDNVVSLAQKVSQSNLTLNVKDYGAKGDGVTDDTQAVLNAVQSAITKGSYALYFPSGTYLIQSSAQITIASANFLLKGDNYNYSVIKFTQATSGFLFDKGNGNSPFRVRLENIQINGNNITTNLLSIPNHAEELVFENVVLTQSAGALINAQSIALCWFHDCDFTYAQTFIQTHDTNNIWIENGNFWQVKQLFNVTNALYFVHINNSWIEQCDQIIYGQTGFSNLASFKMDKCMYIKSTGTTVPFEFQSPVASYAFKFENCKFTITQNCGTLIKINTANTSQFLDVFFETCFIEATSGYLTSIITPYAGSSSQYTRLHFFNNNASMFTNSDSLINGSGYINFFSSGVNHMTGQRGLKFGDVDAYAGRVYYSTASNRLKVTNSSDLGFILALQQTGTTASRPTTNLNQGDFYYDTTLNKPIWLKQVSPAIWVDATGATV